MDLESFHCFLIFSSRAKLAILDIISICKFSVFSIFEIANNITKNTESSFLSQIYPFDLPKANPDSRTSVDSQ